MNSSITNSTEKLHAFAEVVLQRFHFRLSSLYSEREKKFKKKKKKKKSKKDITTSLPAMPPAVGHKDRGCAPLAQTDEETSDDIPPASVSLATLPGA
jgi:hypothetical protein